MPKDRREKRDRHALDDNGMVVCNPRDKEAAHRAQMEGIATDDRTEVTCRKCLALLYKLDRAPPAQRDYTANEARRGRTTDAQRDRTANEARRGRRNDEQR
jgi:hypothetical protein